MPTVRIRLLTTVRSEMPFDFGTVAPPGIYDAESNQHGALSVVAKNGKLLGVKPDEFVRIFQPGTCFRCNVAPVAERHTCPYASEINDDNRLCNCCDGCMSECSDAI